MTRRLIALIAVTALASCASTDDSPAFNYSANVVTRSDWGWQPADIPVTTHSISRITIHHGGVVFAADRDPQEYLRALQRWSRSEKDWSDVPYHFIIDLDGTIHEGRPIEFAGDTNTSYDPSGHALIVVVGDYDLRELTSPQFEALAQLSAFLAAEYSIALSDIKGHKDYAPGETACPGKNIYQLLENGELLRQVQRITESIGK